MTCGSYLPVCIQIDLRDLIYSKISRKKVGTTEIGRGLKSKVKPSQLRTPVEVVLSERGYEGAALCHQL